jgi:hypothetical protein
VHEHTSDCYAATESHTHSAECYAINEETGEEELTCELDEAQGSDAEG